MKKLLLLFAFALCAVPVVAEDLTPVKTRPITQLQPEKTTCVLRSPYFASILNHKSTVRFVMNVAWFVDSRDDLVVDWSPFNYRGVYVRLSNERFEPKIIQPRVMREASYYAYGRKHGVLGYGTFAYHGIREIIQEKKYNQRPTCYWIDDIRYINYNYGNPDLRTGLFMSTE